VDYLNDGFPEDYTGRRTWTTDDARGESRYMANATFDVIVIGVGAMGASACWQLARRGVRVLGLEQFSIGHVLGSSGGQTRMIRLAYYEHPDYVPLLRRAYALWEEMERESGQRVLFKTGGIYMGPENGEVVGGTLTAARLHGLAVQRVSQAQVRSRWPQFRVPDEFVGVWEPEAGFLLSEKAIGVFARVALEAGAEIHGHEAATRIDSEGGGVRVITNKGSYSAGRVVVCGGAWTSKLVRELGVELVVTRQVLGWVWPAKNAERFRLGEFPVWGVEQADGSLAYGFPMLDDYPGLKAARHGRGRPVDPDRVNREATADDEREVRELVGRWLPDGLGPTVAMRICMYTNSPDSHFILDRLPGRENVVIACGFSGHGFKFASVMGEALADLAVEGKTPLPVGFLGLSRFKSTGALSRENV
jgi:sarcosine oxidase